MFSAYQSALTLDVTWRKTTVYIRRNTHTHSTFPSLTTPLRAQALLESVQALTEKKLEADTYHHRRPDSKELPREDGSLPGAPSPTATSATTPLEDAVPA